MTKYRMTTYQEEQNAKQIKKEESAWKKTMQEASVYDLTRVPAATPSVHGALALSKLMKNLDHATSDANSILSKFSEKLAYDPAQAFSWSGDAFDAAGVASVCNEVRWMVDHRPVDEYEGWSDVRLVRHVVETLEKAVLRSARSPGRSSSSQSNEMERSVALAQAKLLDDMRWYVNHYVI